MGMLHESMRVFEIHCGNCVSRIGHSIDAEYNSDSPGHITQTLFARSDSEERISAIFHTLAYCCYTAGIFLLLGIDLVYWRSCRIVQSLVADMSSRLVSRNCCAAVQTISLS